jgi:GTP-binding protein LepA
MSIIKNFVIISHIDHGKSTLADRFLEITKAIPSDKMKPQYLDSMDLEQEKGITIKMHPVRMVYNFQGTEYILNLIDTPGHVDFGYEVSRALACVEGAILLVDVTKGIQAQTIANLEQAQKQNLVIIPAVNKIDDPKAMINETKLELSSLLNISPDEIFEISAKFGTNVKNLLNAVITKIPSPKVSLEKPLRALIFDSKYDSYKGAIAYVKVVEGEIKSGERIRLFSNNERGIVKEVGFFTPYFSPQNALRSGEIGYIATGIKEANKVKVGDTIIKDLPLNIEPLEGYKEPQPMVFTSIYPEDPRDFDLLKSSLEKLKLNDAALTFEQETKEGLGRGFRCGFWGTLHAEIVTERLKREFGLNLVLTNPQVIFEVINTKGEKLVIYSPTDWPDPVFIKETREPWVMLEIITPQKYFGNIVQLLQEYKVNHINTKYLSSEKVLLVYEAPLRIIIGGFYDKLKSSSQGFASMSYEFLEYRSANLVRLDILIAGKKEDVFSKIVPKEEAQSEGRKLVVKLKETLPPQLFSVALQAAVGGKIIARETLRARAKDVIAPLYGGDYTRKRKLLEKQKKGKKELKEKANVRIPSKVFLEIFKSS